MKSSKTGYGLHDTARQIARRVQRAWDETENPQPAQIIAFPMAEIIPFPDPAAPKERRPLAA